MVTSATLDGAKFSAYYGGCPVLTVPGRCHPVEVIHARESHERDHLQAAVDTVLDIHTRQPPGDVLLFLTGQAEIDKARRRPRARCLASGCLLWVSARLWLSACLGGPGWQGSLTRLGRRLAGGALRGPGSAVGRLATGAAARCRPCGS